MTISTVALWAGKNQIKKKKRTQTKVGYDSSVSIATCYKPNGLGTESAILAAAQSKA